MDYVDRETTLNGGVLTLAHNWQLKIAAVPGVEEVEVALQQVGEGPHLGRREPVKRFDFLVIRSERRVEGQLGQPPGEFNVPRRDAIPQLSLRLAADTEFFAAFALQSCQRVFVDFDTASRKAVGSGSDDEL